MQDDAICKTTNCRFKLECLGKDLRYPVCILNRTNNAKALLPRNNDTNINCPYRDVSRKGLICACPTHYLLHNKHQWLKSNSVLGLAGHPLYRQYAQRWKAIPKTIEEAVPALIDELPPQCKLMLANMNVDEVGESASSFIGYIQDAFDLASGNQELMASCSKDAGYEIEHPGDAAAIVLSRMFIELVKTHT